MTQRRVRRRNKQVWYVILGVFVAVFLFSFLVQRLKNGVDATSTGFDPGYIISDDQMSDYTSMNEAEIQAFLKSKNSCNDTSITKYTSGEKVNYLSETSPPRTWHVASGHFVCMADEIFDGGTAAHIIYEVSREYLINPKVLIVLLEKEQSLITDTFPHSQQYRSATGYGCPDTAPCSAKYYGLRNQIRNAAALFRAVLNGGWTNYPLGNNYVQYNPTASCGGSVINIRNRATSALYRYTPYQPNAAVLAGWNDGCGAYGNFNFYTLYEKWFGGITAGSSFNRVEYKDVKQVNIENGTYNILSAVNGPRAMGSVGLANEGNLQTASWNDSTAQQWQIEKVDDYYLIRNKNSGKVIDIANGITSNLINVWQYAENRSCAQRWMFGEEDGTVVIHNACDPSYVLDIQDGKSNIQLYNKSKNKNSNQSWIIKKVNTRSNHAGLYNITASGNKNLSSNEMLNGSNVFFGVSNDVLSSQQWQVEKVDNYYLIRNKGSGKVLDIANGSFKNLTNVWQYAENRSCAQRWIFEDNTNGTVVVRNACYPGFVLDLQEGKTNAQLYSKTHQNNANQNFTLKSAPALKDYSGVYNILASGDQNKSLGVNGMLNADNVATFQANSGIASQQWQIEKVSDYYLIRNKGTGKVLDVADGVLTNQSNMWQYAENRSCAQRWVFWENADGSVAIHNACNANYVLDLESGKDNLQIYTKTSYENSNQKWVLKRI